MSDNNSNAWNDHPCQPSDVLAYWEIREGLVDPAEVEEFGFDFHAVEQHLTHCPQCAQELRDVESMEELFDMAPIEQPLEPVTKKAVDAMVEQHLAQWRSELATLGQDEIPGGEKILATPKQHVGATPFSERSHRNKPIIREHLPIAAPPPKIEDNQQHQPYRYPFIHFLNWRVWTLGSAALLVLIFVTVWHQTTIPVLVDTSGQVSQNRNGQYVLPPSANVSTDISQQVNQLLESGRVNPIINTSALFKPMGKVRGSGNSGAVHLFAPVKTFVRTVAPTLKWEGASGTIPFEIVVRRAADQHEILDATTKQTQLRLSKGLPQLRESLHSGQTYQWQVYSGKGSYSGWATFSILADKDTENLKRLEKRYASSALVLAAIHQSYGLYDEALVQVQQLKQKNPDNPHVDRMLRVLEEQTRITAGTPAVK